MNDEVSRVVNLPVGHRAPALLTAEEVAKVLRSSRALVYQLARRNELGSLRVGNKVLIPQDALDEFIAKNTQRAS